MSADTANLANREDRLVAFRKIDEFLFSLTTIILLASSILFTSAPTSGLAAYEGDRRVINSLRDSISQSELFQSTPANEVLAQNAIRAKTSADIGPDAGRENSTDLTKDIANLKGRIDDIVAFQNRKIPWYRDLSIMIAAAAFFVSIVTSGLSAYRTRRQDINSRKDSLQSIIQQYRAIEVNSVSMQHDIEREIFELQKSAITSDHLSAPTRSFGDDTNPTLQIAKANNTRSRIGDVMTNNNVALAEKALSLIDELRGPLSDKASCVEKTQVAIMLMRTKQYGAAERLLRSAVDLGKNYIEYLGAVKGLAQVQYILRKTDDSDANMKRALDVFTKFKSDPVTEEMKDFTVCEIYIFWAGILINNVSTQEKGDGAKGSAREKLNEAKRFAAKLSSLPMRNTANVQITELERRLG